MRELHVVAVSDDGRHVVLATSPDAKRGTFQVALDARLRSAVSGRLTSRPEKPAGPAPAHVSVKEIQARLRAGESAEEIAAAAGVAVDRIERFAGPVWSEREKMIEAARATPLTHSRRGLSLLPLGEAVDLHFAQIDSFRPESVQWSSRREDSGTWLVEVSYVARARTRSGTWRYDPVARTVHAVDSVSASLGHSETPDGTPPAALPPTRSRPSAPARRTVAAKPAKAAPKPARAAQPAKAPTARPPGVRVPSGTKPAPVVAPPGATVAAKPAAPARKKAASRSTSKPPKAASKAAAPRTVTAEPAAPGSAATSPPSLRVVPALDQQPRQPPASRGRASVPPWADVLLSTSPEPRESSSD